MHTHSSTNRKFRRVFLNLLTIVVILAIAFPVMGSASAEEVAPFFRVFPDWNSVDGGDWPLGASVHLAIDDPITEQAPDYQQDATVASSSEGWISTYVSFDFNGMYDLKPGDEVTVSSDGISRMRVVPTVSITTVDADTNIVSGTFEGAAAGTTVHLFTPGNEGVYVSTDAQGAWSADFDDAGFDLVPGMSGNVEVWLDDLNDSAMFMWSTVQRDEFAAQTLDAAWSWQNGEPDSWSLTDEPGFLRLGLSNAGSLSGDLLLRQVEPGDFAIETRLIFEPNSNYQFAGLVIYQDQNNGLAFGRAFCDAEEGCVGNGLYFDHVADGSLVDGNFSTEVNSSNEVYLRLERRGDMVRAFYSNEGWSWYEIGTHWIPSDFQVNGVGLFAGQDIDTSDENVSAYFDYFELTEGGNLLPDGYHDYDQGDVPSWACGAGGWASDPDDPAARLNVEIVVDDQSVTTLPAGDFRQDLLDAGVCEGGNCSFSTSLWNVVSSYEPHRVDAWAQDYPTGDWVLLRNSAKSLTCRTYDIYSFDPATGTIRPVTDLRDKDEYNPSWSPNGKKVAHDVVNGDGQVGIYITDVKSGQSIPLDGAQDGGNDAAWSPNGKWIVFDRYWVGDSTLYLVTSGGGAAALVRTDAISGDWAPSGKRLAFQQPSDGSIRTVPLDGGQGVETIIAASGANPAWSPDGNWIAYEQDGDIWKVAVNARGAVLGDPIQVTSGAFTDGQPTWSADSQTIIYHSGFNNDWDLWSVPAAGGTPTWLNGGLTYGDYDPSSARNSPAVAYSSFSPDGQAARLWAAPYSYDAGTWIAGPHNYHFEGSWNGGRESTPEISFDVSNEASLYDGFALLRPGAVRAGPDCPAVEAISPDQPTRFLAGYVTDSAMTYADALAYFGGLTAYAVWDDGQTAQLGVGKIFPYREGDWFQYVCTLTAP